MHEFAFSLAVFLSSLQACGCVGLPVTPGPMTLPGGWCQYSTPPWLAWRSYCGGGREGNKDADDLLYLLPYTVVPFSNQACDGKVVAEGSSPGRWAVEAVVLEQLAAKWAASALLHAGQIGPAGGAGVWSDSAAFGQLVFHHHVCGRCVMCHGVVVQSRVEQSTTSAAPACAALKSG